MISLLQQNENIMSIHPLCRQFLELAGTQPRKWLPPSSYLVDCLCACLCHVMPMGNRGLQPEVCFFEKPFCGHASLSRSLLSPQIWDPTPQKSVDVPNPFSLEDIYKHQFRGCQAIVSVYVYMYVYMGNSHCRYPTVILAKWRPFGRCLLLMPLHSFLSLTAQRTLMLCITAKSILIF